MPDMHVDWQSAKPVFSGSSLWWEFVLYEHGRAGCRIIDWTDDGMKYLGINTYSNNVIMCMEILGKL